MKVSKAAAIWIDYHNTHSKKIPFDHINPLLNDSARISVMPKLGRLHRMVSFHF